MINIEEAIKNNFFTLFYQAKVDIEKNKIVGAEALIRLKGENGYISPNQFIPQAEKSGEILKIDKWVAKQVINNAREIFVKTNENITISFNVSPIYFEQESFTKDLENIFTSTKDFLSLFEIEITERAMLKDLSKVKEKVDYLKKVGFKISIDDFGIGYGELTYLKELPIDTLKIDKSFIDNITSDKKTLNIIDSLIYCCKKLNIKSVAEGVETIEQIEILKQLGCKIIQGYYYAKPMSLHKFILFIKSFNNSTSSQFIKYSSEYSTGSYAIDLQHMIIVNLLNKLFEVLKNKERSDFSLKYFTDILDEYLINHLKMEETIMRKYKYPFFQKHRSDHQKFLTEYNKFKKELTEINERNLYNFFNILKEWFIEHEVKEDREMISYLKNKIQL